MSWSLLQLLASQIHKASAVGGVIVICLIANLLRSTPHKLQTDLGYQVQSPLRE